MTFLRRILLTGCIILYAMRPICSFASTAYTVTGAEPGGITPSAPSPPAGCGGACAPLQLNAGDSVTNNSSLFDTGLTNGGYTVQVTNAGATGTSILNPSPFQITERLGNYVIAVTGSGAGLDISNGGSIFGTTGAPS